MINTIMKIVRKPVPLNINFAQCNTNNHAEYTPYILSNNYLIIDKTWYNSLTPYIQNLINTRLDNSYRLDDITIPHEIQKDDPENPKKLLKIVYQSYLDGFDYNVWYRDNIVNGPKNVIIIPFSSEIKQSLLNKDYNNLLSLRNKINENMEKGKSYFIRLSSTSGKNEKAVTPFTDADSILKHLLSVELFVVREYERENKPTCLIMMEWNDSINERCEFRIFVVNNKLVAASPQRYWQNYQYSREELKAFQFALSNIAFNCEYKSYVADVYIDVTTRTCHLIELNPFGAHCGAGSSIFNWITDYNVLHGLVELESESDTAELRYLSAINY